MDTNGTLKAFFERKGLPAYTCPFCGKGGRKGNGVSLNEKTSQFFCFHCGEGGGIGQMAEKIYFGDSLISDNGELDEAKEKFKKAKSISDRAIALTAMEIFMGMETQNSQMKIEYNSTPEGNPECDIVRRNKIYRAMQRLLPLDKAAEESLLERGYTKKQIQAWGYVSLPKFYKDRLAFTKKLIEETGDNLKGVPGFYENKEGQMIIYDGGFYRRLKDLDIPMKEAKKYYLFLCPSYDLNGRLQFFQIAHDKRLSGKNIKLKNGEEKTFPKYNVFSTPWQEQGGSVKVSAGWVGAYKKVGEQIVPDTRGVKRIPIIEGVLKSNLYVCLIDGKEPAIAQVGVANNNQLKKFLADLKSYCPEIEGIDDCYDMDKFTNPAVAKACKKLKQVVEEAGLEYRVRKWDPKYKGADDIALACKKSSNS